MEKADLFGLEGKKALVIGGGQGMGESTAMMLATAGCDVAVLDVIPERAERVAARVRELGRAGHACTADVMQGAEVKANVAAAEQVLGGLDVVVSIVGQAAWADVLEMSIETWDFDHQRNLRYFFLYAQAAAASMVRRGVAGSITAIASVSGLESAPRHAAYGAAKAGLINLVKSMAVELAPHRVRVNAIAPGSIVTPRIVAGGGEERLAERVRTSLIPYKESGTTDDIGKAALFLSSDLARYVSGQALAVDGGWTAAFLLPI